MKLHYLQHVPFENLGNIEKWALNKGFSISCTKLFKNEPLLDIESFDFLVILGGPMNIYEEDKFPWLKKEKEFIKKAVENNKTILGICLGAQLIADVLGAKVYKNQNKEIGWFPIKLTEEAKNTVLFKDISQEFTAFHWHGDTFDIPEKSILICSSEACKNQGFVYNNKVIGLQFHLETSPTALKNLAKNCKDEITDEKYIQTPEFMLSQQEKFKKLEEILNRFMDNII